MKNALEKCLLVTVLAVSLASFARPQQPPPVTQTPNVAQSFGLTCGGTLLGNSCTYTPTSLGFNAVTLPASTVTANSNIVNMRGVRVATLAMSCTQSFTMDVNEYAEDGATLLRSDAVATAVATNGAYYFGETGTAILGGTGSAAVRLPEPYLSFYATNGGATPGTCTGRLYVEY